MKRSNVILIWVLCLPLLLSGQRSQNVNCTFCSSDIALPAHAEKPLLFSNGEYEVYGPSGKFQAIVRESGIIDYGGLGYHITLSTQALCGSNYGSRASVLIKKGGKTVAEMPVNDPASLKIRNVNFSGTVTFLEQQKFNEYFTCWGKHTGNEGSPLVNIEAPKAGASAGFILCRDLDNDDECQKKVSNLSKTELRFYGDIHVKHVKEYTYERSALRPYFEKFAKTKLAAEKLVRKGDNAYSKKLYAEAISWYEEAKSTWPEIDVGSKIREAKTDGELVEEYLKRAEESLAEGSINGANNNLGFIANYDDNEVFASRINDLKARVRNETDRQELIKKGDELKNSGKFDEAKEEYEKALEFKKDDSEVKDRLAEVTEKVEAENKVVLNSSSDDEDENNDEKEDAKKSDKKEEPYESPGDAMLTSETNSLALEKDKLKNLGHTMTPQERADTKNNILRHETNIANRLNQISNPGVMVDGRLSEETKADQVIADYHNQNRIMEAQSEMMLNNLNAVFEAANLRQQKRVADLYASQRAGIRHREKMIAHYYRLDKEQGHIFRKLKRDVDIPYNNVDDFEGDEAWVYLVYFDDWSPRRCAEEAKFEKNVNNVPSPHIGIHRVTRFFKVKRNKEGKFQDLEDAIDAFKTLNKKCTGKQDFRNDIRVGGYFYQKSGAEEHFNILSNAKASLLKVNQRHTLFEEKIRPYIIKDAQGELKRSELYKEFRYYKYEKDRRKNRKKRGVFVLYYDFFRFYNINLENRCSALFKKAFESDSDTIKLELWNRYIARKENSSSAYYNRGLVHKRQKKYKRAIEDFLAASNLGSELEDKGKASAHAGLMLMKINDYEKAIEAFEKAIANNYGPEFVQEKIKICKEKIGK